MPARTMIGAAKVSAVLDSEGAFFLPLSEAFPSLCEDVQEVIGLSGHDPTPPTSETWWLSFRVYVVEVDDRVILVDTGAASDTTLRAFWAPTGPHLTQRLFDELGLPAELVTDVVLTHLHRDHAAGSIDASGGPAFPRARYHIQATEVQTVNDRDPAGLWMPLLDPLRVSGQLNTIAGNATLTVSGDTVLQLEQSPGHTAGHQSLAIASAESLLVLAGDVFTHAMQLIDPYARYAFDADPSQAGRTRYDLLNRLRAVGGSLGTAHLDRAFVVTH